MTPLQILGWAMIVALFAGIFVFAAKLGGWAEAAKAYAIAAGMVAFITVASWLIKGQ